MAKSTTTKKPKPTAARKKTTTTTAVAAEPVTKTKAATRTLLAPTEKLYRFNIGITALLLLQAAAIVVFGEKITTAVTTHYLAVDTLATAANGHQMLATATRHLFDVRVAYLVAAFLVLLAAVHTVAATVYRKRYEAAVARGVSETRWLGLGLGGAGLVIVLALLSGINDIGELLMLAVFVLGGCLLVLAAEVLHAREPKARLPHVVCGVGTAGAAVMPLVILAVTTGGVFLYDGKLPGYLYGVYASAILFAVALLVLTHFRIKRQGRWADAYRTEQAYMVLGLVGASLIAWQVFVGAL